MKTRPLVLMIAILASVSCSDDATDRETETPSTTGGAASSGGDAGLGGLATGGLAAVQGTGGEGAQNDCSPFEACGGDPTGSWRFVGMCFLPNLPTCPDLAVTGSGTIEGTYEVSANRTTASARESAEFTVAFPKACLDDTPCDQAFAGFGSAVGAQVVATETSDSCLIAITQPPFENSVTRAVEIEGSTMTDEASRETSFCQRDNRLRIRASDDNPLGVVYTLEAR